MKKESNLIKVIKKNYFVIGIIFILIISAFFGFKLYKKSKCEAEITKFRTGIEKQILEQFIPDFESELKVITNKSYYQRIYALPLEDITPENINRIKLQYQEAYNNEVENFTKKLFINLNESVKDYETTLKELNIC